MDVYSLKQVYFIWHEKESGSLKHVLDFAKEKINLGSPRSLLFVSNGMPQSYLDPIWYTGPWKRFWNVI
jgi:hypothetical protein